MDELFKPALMQRAKGRVGLHVCGDKIARLYQSGCGKLILPKTYGDMREAVLLNTAGGITGGDRLDISVTAEDCTLVATSQTAERLYKSNMYPAQINVDLTVARAATLHWMPQETIIFDGAGVDRNIRVDMSADGTCLLAETITLGREAMGESVEHCHFTDQWRLYRDGILFHGEALRLTGDIASQMHSVAGGNGARFLTTIIYVGPDAEAQSRTICPLVAALRSAAASYWQDRIIIRLITDNAKKGRQDVNRLLGSLRQQPLPRVWQL